MKTFRIGVIGAGAIAQHAHIPGYAAAKNCVLAAVADPEPRCLAEVAAKGWRFERVYSDYRRMLAEVGATLDAVSVCTPNYLHKEIAVACLRAGCEVLLEKPVALTLADALAIKAAARKHRRRVMVGFTHRFNGLNVAARAALKAGKIGRPFMARVRFAHTGPWPGWAKTDWFYRRRKAGGGAMLDMAVHAFDLLHWYLGPATAVQARVATLRKPIEVDDNALALLEFGKGCLGYVEAGWTSPVGYCGVELMGDAGAIFVDYGRAKTTMIRGVRTPDGRSCQETVVLADGVGAEAWRSELAHFTKGLAGRGSFCVGIDEGIAALKVTLAAYRSSRTGRRIRI